MYLLKYDLTKYLSQPTHVSKIWEVPKINERCSEIWSIWSSLFLVLSEISWLSQISPKLPSSKDPVPINSPGELAPPPLSWDFLSQLHRQRKETASERDLRKRLYPWGHWRQFGMVDGIAAMVTMKNGVLSGGWWTLEIVYDIHNFLVPNWFYWIT